MELAILYQSIDVKRDYDSILKLFLDNEHVSSEKQWIEMYCKINCVREDKAYQVLSNELTTFLLLEEMNNNKILDRIKKEFDDTSCLCMTREELYYEESFKTNIVREFVKIEQISYELDCGCMFITGIKSNGNRDTHIYMALNEHADEIAKREMPTRQKELSKEEFDMKQKILITIWNDRNVRVPFVKKLKVELKYNKKE